MGTLRVGEQWGLLRGQLEFWPYEDTLTVLLLAAILSVVGWSVQLADWLDGPLMQPTLLLGGVVSFLTARARLHWLSGHALSFMVAFVVVFWQAGLATEATNIVSSSREVWERFFMWLEAAREGGISSDPLPFGVLLLTASWLVAYAAGWVLFRWRNAWFPSLVLGTGIVVNLSYRPGQFEHTLFMFIGLAVVLFAHTTAIKQAATWREQAVRFPSQLRRASLGHGILIAIPVVLIAALLPVWEPRSDSLRTVYDKLREPILSLEDPFQRLLSGVKGRGGSSVLSDFNQSLPFQGPVSLTDEPVMFVETDVPTPHPGRIYTKYTSAGWKTGATVRQQLSDRSVLTQRQDLKERELVTQVFRPNHTTGWAMPVGGTASLNRSGINEVLAPLEFKLSMNPRAADPALPEDVRDAREQLRKRFVLDDAAPGDSLETEISQTLPDSLRLIAFEIDDAGDLVSIRAGRPDPGPREQIAFFFDQPVTPGEAYTVRQFISRAADEELREAGPDYPAWVTDRYLQLPDSLPQRVQNLAQQVVTSAGAETPLDKVKAISGYLRDLSYSQQIDGPPVGHDGVDYFLFETAEEPCPQGELRSPCEDEEPKGYSQYFGSAMAVLLRAVDVPARMIAGYAPGTWLSEQEQFVIRDSDRHGWAQAYFPDYGWVDVEATPGYAIFRRDLSLAGSTGGQRPLTEGELYDQGFFPAEEDLEELRRQALQLAAARRGENAGETGFPVVAVAAPLGGMAGLLMVLVVAWNFGMGRFSASERAYLKMARLGWLAGLGRSRNHTATEYGQLLSSALPGVGAAPAMIASEYERRIYGRRDGKETEPPLDEHWRNVRSALLHRMLRRMIGRAGRTPVVDPG